jgi:DNA-binding SARP family transcriptional activator
LDAFVTTIRVIGSFEIATAARTVGGTAFLARSDLLVKLLALATNHTMHRDEAIETVWPESSLERGRNNLHKAMHALRRSMLGVHRGELISLQRAMLTLSSDCVIDLDEFERAATTAHAVRTTAALEEALAYVRGSLLPADVYQDWTARARERFQVTVAGLRIELAGNYLDDGELALAEAQLRNVLQHDPLDERAHRTLMRTFVASGDVVNALRQYEACVAALREIDVSPSDETTALLGDITTGATPLDFSPRSNCPRIQFARSADDARIAYHAFGDGIPLVHMAQIPWNSLDLEWRVPAWRAWHERLGHGRRLVRYDNRGQGVSDRQDATISLETAILDLEAVVNTLELESFDLYSGIHSGLAAIAYASSNASRVRRLVLWIPYARGADYRDLPFVTGGAVLAQTDWQMFCSMVAGATLAMEREEVMRAVTSVMINSSSPELTASAMADYWTADVTERLAQLDVPVLALQPGPHENFLPPRVVEDLVARLPNGTLRSIEGAATLPIIGNVDGVIDAIHGFLDS